MNANILINFNLDFNVDVQLERFDELTAKLAAKGITVGKNATVSTVGVRDGKYAIHYRKLAGKNFRTPKGQNREDVARRLLDSVFGAEAVADAEKAGEFVESVENESSEDTVETVTTTLEDGDDDDVV